MGTGGQKQWVREAFDLVDYLNRCIQAMDHEFGAPGVKPPRIKQLGPGRFSFSFAGKEWLISIDPKNLGDRK